MCVECHEVSGRPIINTYRIIYSKIRIDQPYCCSVINPYDNKHYSWNRENTSESESKEIEETTIVKQIGVPVELSVTENGGLSTLTYAAS